MITNQMIIAGAVAFVGFFLIAGVYIAIVARQQARSTGFGWRRDGYEPIEHFDKWPH